MDLSADHPARTAARTSLLAAGLVAAGLTLAGLLVGLGFARGRADDRFVSVKGVSEREVQADLAIWPLRVLAADNDLAAANASLRTSMQRLLEFLARQGIDSTQLSLQDFSVADAYANQYGGGQITSRYVIRQTVVVRSTNPTQVLAASQRVPELVSAGVVLSSGTEYGGSSGPTFLFTNLNAEKPAMIAEATARAREAAEQFARDSRASLGGIRRANQGVFEILARDQAPGISQESQVVKTVRVVSTVEYLLR
jgi:hypothetical protein